VKLIGISAYHADAAAAAVDEGRFVAGVEEERFTRIKHWAGFPAQSLRWCLSELGGAAEALEAIAVARQPRAYLLQKAWLAITHPRSLVRAGSRVGNLAALSALGPRIASTLGLGDPPRVIAVEHHLAHLASAFYCSPYEEAACLSVDGFGDFVSTMLARGTGNRITPLERVHYPHSLGLFYTAITQFLGFRNFGDEYKVMGLAAYGEPRFVSELEKLVPSSPGGLFELDLRYFRHLSEGVDMTWDDGSPRLGLVFSAELERLLGPSRRVDEELAQRHKDLAASMQRVYESRFFSLARLALRLARSKRLCLAGGCALNSLANGRLFENCDVEEVFIQSAAGDSGTSLGAALYAHHDVLGRARSGFVMEHSAWGPAYDEQAVRRAIGERMPGSEGLDGAHSVAGDLVDVRTIRDADELSAECARAIARGEVVGWYQGRSEWGPRALGQRSILGDPRRADMKDILNLKIKRRESFRPFAPSILEERTGEWFTIAYPDPFMLKVYPIRPEQRSRVPAVTHVDGTGRVQTVSQRSNPRYWSLIRAFEAETGVPLVLNTSFNENEPIVNTPSEALDCFLRTRMDRLVMGDVVLVRRTRES
jgi:carbamoyltransferase